MQSSKDTVCAISTAQGMGAIAVIRLSGSQSIEICEKVFSPARKGKVLSNQKANTIHFGSIGDGNKDIDEVLVSIFKAPHSFTGEEIVEIACHGAPYIQQQILQLLTANGARLATAGEFTQRAFLNGKMDLSQAEAVADLIASRSEAARRVALQQMRGGFSNELINLRTQLLNFISLIELELDFSEEDVEFANRSELMSLIDEMMRLLTKLTDSFSLGNAIKNGIPVAIVGHTNAGKSTLLNTLLQEDKAIVSDIHGTTRDVIEDTINIEGISFRFIDTAGIRATKDEIENLGIERTYDKISKASIVLLMLDVNDPDTKIHEAIIDVKNRLDEHQQLIVVINKMDLAADSSQNRFNKEIFKELSGVDAIVPISAKKLQNIDALTSELLKTVNLSAIDNDEVIVTNVRHYEALKKSLDAVERVSEGLSSGISGDFLAQDIREVLHFLGEITGHINTDEVLGNIFKNFCIGK
ncbi:tRNA uridine-5-carboxymethylaminomethyl(34) synthesis GTPase MnmE [Carboxylicivirga sp. M1479]|uniref:tRNA uridine-5-carboxymethylaminomethyl(34) synthesis GTPase MnmE n=1 Tax=Carboxylicivirga sp. M1479 TaxID=2594476 RepID=UPI0011788F19|nr:tRNA uridine-5-carboxymethylaminomethyl(34) synthesis GTPase MnmE [Carboxylicivirga sp. M1479]TRX66060.1 tRNA uridine-5-carboxymethylaminomethyl(34) synthesis GTPase MnmE [Carboxylicivirga sp. M1479]